MLKRLRFSDLETARARATKFCEVRTQAQLLTKIFSQRADISARGRCHAHREIACALFIFSQQLAVTLKAVISQRLVRRADDKGRVPAVEIMIATPYIRDCVINPDKTRLIHDAIAAGTSQYGMQTFDQSLFDLYSKQLITIDEALARASNADEFKLRIQGIRSASDAAREEMERQMADFERFARK